MMAFYPVLDFDTVEPAYDLSIDWRVVGFSLAVSIMTGFIFGLVPALQASKPDLVPTLKGETMGPRGPRRLGLSNALVIAQVALSLVLLITAGLFIRSVQYAERIDPGFDTRNIMLSSVDLGLQGYEQAKGRNFYKNLVERVGSIPGVESAAVAFPLPLDAYDFGTRVDIEGYQPPPDEGRVRVGFTIAGPGYFSAMGTAATGPIRTPSASGSGSATSATLSAKSWAWPKTESTSRWANRLRRTCSCRSGRTTTGE
jgi:hypothetical protein